MKKVDITGGPIIKSVISYAFPVMLGSLVQVAFNAADLIAVGNMGNANSVAAVGAVGPITSLLVTSFVGLSAGVNAVLARCLGQKNEARINRVINTAVIFAFVFGIVIMGGCFAFSKPLLEAVGCEDSYFDQAMSYMRIYAIGIPALMVYNFSAAIIRTTGDTQRPFIYLVIAGAMNVILNFILCLFLEQKAAAVAVATTASQFTGAILCFIHLARMKGACGLDIKHMTFSFRELLSIIKIGAPCAFNSALFSLSNLQMHSAINSYGANATAGNAAASNLETLVSCFATGFNAATVPFVGQNVGAGNKDRVRQSILCCLSISAVCSLIASVVIYALGKYVLMLYLPGEPEAIVYGISRMRYVLLFYVIAATYNIFVGAMQAFGYSFVPMINSIITVLAFRLMWLEFVYPRLEAVEHTIDNVYMCYSFSWLLTLVAHFTMFIIIYKRYTKGKVRSV